MNQCCQENVPIKKKKNAVGFGVLNNRNIK